MRFSRPSTLSPSLYRITDEFLVQVGVPNESRLRDNFWIELFIADDRHCHGDTGVKDLSHDWRYTRLFLGWSVLPHFRKLRKNISRSWFWHDLTVSTYLVIEASDAICVTNLYEMLVVIEEEQWAGCYCWEEERVGKHLQKIWHYEYLLKILLIISWTKSHDIKRLHEDLGLLELITLCRISVSFSSLFSLAFPS